MDVDLSPFTWEAMTIFLPSLHKPTHLWQSMVVYLLALENDSEAWFTNLPIWPLYSQEGEVLKVTF